MTTDKTLGEEDARARGRWRRFSMGFFVSAAGLLGILFTFTVMIDPYDTVLFSPPLVREPISSNQRFSYPAIARNPRYDSAVFGTSTARLLRPEKLGAVLGGRFANLSLNSGTAYEQGRMADLFVSSRPNPAPRTLIIGIDTVWCDTNTLPKLTERAFPEWMYDANRWNDLRYHLNFAAIENAGRQAARLLGLREAKYGIDGYKNFLPDPGEYDIEKARIHIYGGKEPKQHPTTDLSGEERAEIAARVDFPQLDILRDVISRVPDQTMKVALFVPYHVYRQPPPGTEGAVALDRCKSEVTEIFGASGRHMVVDFMIPSDITMEDSNYWDAVHYSTDTADRIVDVLGRMRSEGHGIAGTARLLSRGE